MGKGWSSPGGGQLLAVSLSNGQPTISMKEKGLVVFRKH